MLKKNLCIVFLLVISNLCFSQKQSGAYFNQTPPGLNPEIFAPGIVSVSGRFEQSITDTPDGKEFYFTVTNSSWNSFEIWTVKEDSTGWSTPLRASIPGANNDAEAFISPDSKWMYFISTRSPGTFPWGTDIWMMERSNDDWLEPINIASPIHSSAGEWGVSVSKKRTLCFGSDRSGGKGMGDIYIANLVNDSYPEVINVGDSINTKYVEYDPFIAPDESYIIFQSKNRPSGYGDNDLYISFKKDDGLWTEAKNMGSSINTSAKEINPSVSKDGKYLFFTRRTGTESDIYWVNIAIINQFRPAIDYFGQNPPGSIPEVFAPGFISLDNRFEQNAAFTPDGKEFYFSTTTNNWDGFRIYFTKQVNGEWSESKETTSILGNYDNTEPFISYDGQNLFFVSPRPSAPPWNTDIWICERNDTTWTSPKKVLEPVSTNNREWHPSVSLNGTLYFQSLNRSGGLGAADIYRAELNNGQYITAENLSDVINSSYGDGEATIAPDESYLIFTSYRPGYGQSDIYISFNQNNSWTEPINLGPKINTDQAEYATALSPDGKYLFFTRRKALQTSEDSDIYWVSTSFIDSLENITSVEKRNYNQPQKYNLYQNYPNPFNPNTTINYTLMEPGEVKIIIYNSLGQKIKTLIDNHQTSGRHSIAWNGQDEYGNNVSSGIYFYQLEVNNNTISKRMILMK